MLYLPPLRRLLPFALIAFIIIVYYRSTSFSSLILEQPYVTAEGERVLAIELETRNLYHTHREDNYKSPPTELYYTYEDPAAAKLDHEDRSAPYWTHPAENPYLQQLFECPIPPNRFTNHIRIPYYIRNITLTFNGDTDPEKKPSYLNPTIISLPFWSENQYLLVGRVGTDGSYMENLICEANICFTDWGEEAREGEKRCNASDLALLGGGPGMRCAQPPKNINVPPTPAEACEGDMSVLMDIPGFHDPRIFWSGRGEPLMMVNTQSRYACFGLWVIDLRRLHFGLDELLAQNPWNHDYGPLMSYPSLTELTRNPAKTRGSIEKNWMFFATRNQGTYLHYDMGPTKRTFAKLLGSGLTTVNLTDGFEYPCLENIGSGSSGGSWHQATNSLRLILCTRDKKGTEKCKPNGDNEVFFSVIHHKHKGHYGLPIRYERYFMMWSAVPPFSMLGVSKHPILLLNETAHPWNAAENWEDDLDQQHRVESMQEGKDMWATFTYTVSLAYGFRKGDQPQDKVAGYLDDDVVLGIGVDDWSMVFSRVPAKDLLQCMRACPGRQPNRFSTEDMLKLSPDRPDEEDEEEKEGEGEEIVVEIDEEGFPVDKDKEEAKEGEDERRKDDKKDEEGEEKPRDAEESKEPKEEEIKIEDEQPPEELKEEEKPAEEKAEEKEEKEEERSAPEKPSTKDEENSKGDKESKDEKPPERKGKSDPEKDKKTTEKEDGEKSRSRDASEKPEDSRTDKEEGRPDDSSDKAPLPKSQEKNSKPPPKDERKDEGAPSKADKADGKAAAKSAEGKKGKGKPIVERKKDEKDADEEKTPAAKPESKKSGDEKPSDKKAEEGKRSEKVAEKAPKPDADGEKSKGKTTDSKEAADTKKDDKPKDGKPASGKASEPKGSGDKKEEEKKDK